MATPGLTVEPIALISGASEFAQVWFEDVKVPKINLVGELDKGWTVAKALLKHERSMMSALGSDIMGGNISLPQVAKNYIGVDDQGRVSDPVTRDAITQHEMNMRAIELTAYRTHQETLARKMDTHVPLIMKFLGTRELQTKDELLVDIMGYRALGWLDDQFDEQELRAGRELLFNKAMTIAGGTNEIQLNIIAKQALSLPEE